MKYIYLVFELALFIKTISFFFTLGIENETTQLYVILFMIVSGISHLMFRIDKINKGKYL